MKNLKKYIASILVIALVLGALPINRLVNAQENEYQSDLETVLERFEEIEATTEEIDLEEVPALAQVFLSDIENNRFLIQTALSNLDFEEKTVLEDDESNFHIVIPIVSPDYNMLSNFHVIYDENFVVMTYAEQHFQESENGFFEIISYLKGVLIAETETEFEFVENEEFESQLQELETALTNPRLRSAGCVVGIIGIGLVVAGLLTAACIPWCIATIGTGCATCFGTFVAVTPAIVTLVVTRCF